MKKIMAHTMCCLIPIPLLGSTSLGFAAPLKLRIESKKGTVEFLAVGRPALLKIKGQGLGPEGDLNLNDQKVIGKLTFDVSSLNTGIGLRDEHMKRKYLEMEKYPRAELDLQEMNLPAMSDGQGPQSTPFKGNLLLHGTTRPIEGISEVELKKDEYHVKAKFNLDLKDFKIEIPSYSGITVASSVEVEINFNVKR